ncbi:hypothetical protein ACEN9F_15505 [Duganella sp. CT11-25]|uniref:hypothetical protein n=1 Tax=unclassified Duganella TaxID=2636909 RepID=UPI0039AF1EA6
MAERLLACGIECYRIVFPKGMDANEYALKVQPASKSLGALIRKAVWMGNGEAPAQPSPVPAAAPMSVLPLAAKEEPEPVAPEPLPASPMPAPAFAIEAEVKDNEVVLAFGERRYRVRGLSKNLAYDVLKVNVLASHGDAFHVDTFDLYNARARASYIAQAAIELRMAEDVLKADLGRLGVGGQPTIPKNFSPKGASAGTSPISKGLSKALPQKLPMAAPAPTTAKPLATSNVLGRVLGRWAPFIGWGIIANDVSQYAACIKECIKNENCTVK